jgi:hypothetical protein
MFDPNAHCRHGDVHRRHRHNIREGYGPGPATDTLTTAATVPDDVWEALDEIGGVLELDDVDALADVDPHLARTLLTGYTTCLRARTVNDPHQQRAQIRLGLERIRQALRELTDDTSRLGAPPADVLAWLTDNLPVAQSDLALLLKVSGCGHCNAD